ncbi:MAG: hypothetical protein Q9224_004880, partial [Gallowayella concinna]
RNAINDSQQMLMVQARETLLDIIHHIEDVRLDEIPRNVGVQGIETQFKVPHVKNSVIGGESIGPISSLDAESNNLKELFQVHGRCRHRHYHTKVLECSGLEIETANSAVGLQSCGSTTASF